MVLPLYQKHLIDALRIGSRMWMDNFGKTTYHININNKIKEINEPTILTLVWHGLIKMNGNEYVLTELGISANIFSVDEGKKTLYSM